VAGIDHDCLELTEIGNHLRAQLWLDRFRKIDARDKVLTILFDDGEAEPVANAVDHHLATIELELDGVLSVLEADSLVRRRGFAGETVEFRNVIDGQVIAIVELDDLPIGGGEGRADECEEGNEDKGNRTPAEHWAGIMEHMERDSN